MYIHSGVEQWQLAALIRPRSMGSSPSPATMMPTWASDRESLYSPSRVARGGAQSTPPGQVRCHTARAHSPQRRMREPPSMTLAGCVPLLVRALLARLRSRQQCLPCHLRTGTCHLRTAFQEIPLTSVLRSWILRSLNSFTRIARRERSPTPIAGSRPAPRPPTTPSRTGRRLFLCLL